MLRTGSTFCKFPLRRTLEPFARPPAPQAIVGGAAYGVSLAVMLLRPALYQRAREPLMMSCLLGRTLARLLMSTLPAYFHMSGSVIKYIVYGLDILLDGLLEGAFEQVRIRRGDGGCAVGERRHVKSRCIGRFPHLRAGPRAALQWLARLAPC